MPPPPQKGRQQIQKFQAGDAPIPRVVALACKAIAELKAPHRARRAIATPPRPMPF
jgi:hypothetical protein